MTRWFDEQFDLAIQEIDWDSTPGCCSLKALGTTNREIFGWDGVSCDPERVEFVRGAVRARFDQLARGERVADPLNVFIKREPVKKSKEEKGAYRLISGVSLIDCLVDRILFGWLLRVCLDTVLETPSMIGWSPIRGGWRFITRFFAGKPVVSIDKQAWDWTVIEWMIKDFITFLKALPYNPPQWWLDMVQLRMELLYRYAVFQFQDGTVLEQGEWGIQKSGSLLTIILNTVLQIMLHYRARPKKKTKILGMGDDTSQEEPDDLDGYIKALERLGPKIKEAKVQHWVEFAGFAFLQKSCVPAYWKKHMYTLKYSENPVETLQSYQILYAHDPEMFAYLEAELARFGARYALPRHWCRSVMDEE